MPEIQSLNLIITNEFKKELDNRYTDYKNGGKMVSAAEANKQIKDLLKKGKKK